MQHMFSAVFTAIGATISAKKQLPLVNIMAITAISYLGGYYTYQGISSLGSFLHSKTYSGGQIHTEIRGVPYSNVSRTQILRLLDER